MSKTLLHFDYLSPRTIKEAGALLAKHKGAKLLAGGTDLMVSLREGAVTPEYVINLKAIADLSYIRSDGEGLKIGATTTIHDIEHSPIVQERSPILASAAHQLGSPLIRTMATIGGNLCNATPSADTPPALVALNASVRLVSARGERTLPLSEFFVGPGKTALKNDEILTEIQIPIQPAHSGGAYATFFESRAEDRTAAGVAAIITLDAPGTKVAAARIVLGTVAPTPVRAGKAEDILTGKAISDELIEQAAQAAAEAAIPRRRLFFKKELVKVLARQAIKQAADSAKPPA
ncbi:MAG: xanthine dehydrogenase family protein subunit M [Chloroflexota bacterium]